MMSRVSPELTHAMVLALESCETDVENALQLLGRSLRRMETVRTALGGAVDGTHAKEAS